MTPAQAAKVIGCSPSHCRDLIRSGILPAAVVDNPASPGNIVYNVSQEDAEAFRDKPRSSRGWERGRKRKAGAK